MIWKVKEFRKFSLLPQSYPGLKYRLFNLFTLFQNVSLPDTLSRIEQKDTFSKTHLIFLRVEEGDFQLTKRGEIW